MSTEKKPMSYVDAMRKVTTKLKGKTLKLTNVKEIKFLKDFGSYKKDDVKQVQELMALCFLEMKVATEKIN